ncbi:MAG: hypothetical protein R3E39_18160 [Anaerolineae bacterium]
MNTIRKITIVLTLVVISALMVAPTFAAGTKVITKTEDQINKSYWVTNPAWRAVTNRYVDLQPGQVVVKESITRRGKDPVAVEVTYTPSVENNRIFWTAISVTVNGQAASQELIDQVNANRTYSWANYWKRNGGSGKVQSVEITDTEIKVTVATNR